MSPERSAPIRILVVDDSFFMRRVIRDTLAKHPELVVVGEAADGRGAIEQAARLRPDVIILDYFLPNFTGAQTIGKILQQARTNPPAIIMLSAYTTEGAEETFECLKAGAVDFIVKPSGELSVSLEAVEEKLVQSIVAAASSRVKLPEIAPVRPARSKPVAYPAPLNKIVVIGASTGGPVVLEKIFSALPADLPAALIIVQHMPEFFISRFVARLDKAAPLDLREARGGELLRPGQVFFAPGNQNLELRIASGTKISIALTPPSSGQVLLPSIDVTMASAAAAGKKVIGLILTGMGEDGAAGMTAIKQAGGYTIIQDLESAVVDSMPRSVLQRRQVDEILPPEKIAPRLIQLCF